MVQINWFIPVWGDGWEAIVVTLTVSRINSLKKPSNMLCAIHAKAPGWAEAPLQNAAVLFFLHFA